MIPEISFSPNSNNLQSLVEIIDLQSLQERKDTMDHDPESPHRVEFYMLIHIEEGYGKQFIDFRAHHFEPNSLLFVNKQQINAFDFSQNPKGKIMMFTDGFITQVQSNMRIPLFSPFYLTSFWQPVFVPTPELHQRCQVLIREVAQELQHKEAQKKIIFLLFSALLMLIMREKKSTENALSLKQFTRFQNFGRLLEARFNKSHDASDYADWLNITYKTLNQACKHVSQQTAKQVIDHYLILEAKRRLTLDEQSIQQLTDELGFDEPTNFVKYFKKHTGLTPARFRSSSNYLSGE